MKRMFNLWSRNLGSSISRSFSSSARRTAQIHIRFPMRQKPDGEWKSWNPRTKLAFGLGGAGGIYFVAHLEKVPETGRWRFMNTSPSSEAKLSEELAKELRRETASSTLPPNHPISRHVRRVVSQILHASNLGTIRDNQHLTSIFSDDGMQSDTIGSFSSDKQWDVIVVHNPKMINAMVTPGLIIVFTGILPICHDEEGLAAVLSHEIGHVVARHTAERLSSASIFFGLIILAQLFAIDMNLSSLLHTYLLELPNSRKQEREADLIGLRLMSKACYNPEAAPQMFAKLALVENKSGKSSTDFFSTHPSSESRVKELKDRLPEAYAILNANSDCAQMQQQLAAFKETAHPVKVADFDEM